MCLMGEFRVFLLGRSGGVDLLQLGQSEGSGLGIFAGEVGIEIGQLRLTLLQLRNDQTDLQTPVAQMDVTDGVVAQELVQPLQCLADDGRTQMANVQGLGNVGAAVVHHDGLALADFLNAEVGFGAHLFQIIAQEGIGQLQVDEAGHNSLHHGVIVGIQLLSHSLGDHNGGAFILLGGGQSAVALIFTQVRPVGYGHTAESGIITCVRKGLLHFRGDNI